MNVGMWMTRTLVTIGPDTPVTEAAALMAQKRIRRLLVAEQGAEGLRLLGIVSASDVLHSFPPEVNPFAVIGPDARRSATKVHKIMNRQVQTTMTDTPLEEAALMMCDGKIGALPVIHGKHLVGIITESDIFRALVGLFATREPGARITFDVSKNEDVFSVVAQASQRHGVRVASLIQAQQGDQPVCVVRVVGERTDAFLDDMWASGHLVLNVIRFPHETGQCV